ncbi:MAG: hypothetical protein K9H64_04705 [Bacteroidales bacterium]|nr:hypothetical protein [Bacteroidales bacterium]MCF8455096.1 hypothetical protein [Bacteroidales bacterium]
MKTNYFTLSLWILAFLFIIPLSACDHDDENEYENEEVYNFTTLNDLSAVWNLESGYSELFFSYDSKFLWLDNECENAVDGLGNPLPQEFNDQRVLSKTFNYDDALATYNQILTTTNAFIFDTIYYVVLPKNEYENAYSKSNVQINFDYELTLKKNGEYKIYITYNYFDPDAPLYNDDNPEMQYGKTYSGAFEFVSEWQWVDNSIGLREGIQFHGFPMPVVKIMAIFDFTGIYSPLFDFNYVSGIDFSIKDRFFEVEKLSSTELVLLTFDNENHFSHNQDNEFEAYLSSGFQLDCMGTYTETNVTNENIYFKFVSNRVDGRNK